MALFIVINVQLLCLLGYIAHTTLAEDLYTCVLNTCKFDPHNNADYYTWLGKSECVKENCMTDENRRVFGENLFNIARFAHDQIALVAESFVCRQSVVKDVTNDCEWEEYDKDKQNFKDTSLEDYCIRKKFARDCVSAAINSTCSNDPASYVHDVFDAYIANLHVYVITTNYTFGNNHVCDDLLRPDRTLHVETTPYYIPRASQELPTTGEPYDPDHEGTPTEGSGAVHTFHFIGHVLTLLTLIFSIF